MAWADVCHEQVGIRVADHLRVIYPRNAEKLIARDFKVHEATAKGWLAGNVPANKHMTRMVQHWGKTFLDFIYAPVIGAANIDTRLESLISEIAAIRADNRRTTIAPALRMDGAIPHVASGNKRPPR